MKLRTCTQNEERPHGGGAVGNLFQFLFLSFAFFKFLLKFQLVTYSAILESDVWYSDVSLPCDTWCTSREVQALLPTTCSAHPPPPVTISVSSWLRVCFLVCLPLFLSLCLFALSFL